MSHFKWFRHLHLLTINPQKFFANLEQYTNPKGFTDRLLDMVHVAPLNVHIRQEAVPTLNVLLPEITPSAMTGGPNTVLNIGYRLAVSGLPVRFVSCDALIGQDIEWFWNHLRQLTGITERPSDLQLGCGTDGTLRIGANDLLMASYWTTAHQANEILHKTRRERFLYLIQDFEPGFYPWSSNYAQALETYYFPFKAIINEGMLADHLFASGLGRFSDSSFRSSCTIFEPAVDREVFRLGPTNYQKRRLLIYARPTNARNMLGMAIAALKQAIQSHVFETDEWEFLTLGARGSLPEIDLGDGHVLREAPWRSYTGYADLLRTSDILLCPMLSPHTSYPVLEMAASGGLSVTNTFSTKTFDRLAAISKNIIAVKPTVAGFTSGIIVAANRDKPGEASVSSPATWYESFGEVYQMVEQELGGHTCRFEK